MTTLPSKILSLARAGNPVRAWRLFGELGLDEVADDITVLTLKGRLLKDLAWRAEGEERARRFRDASGAYLAAHALKPDSYPLINAASLALMAGEAVQSRDLARQVLELIETNPDEGETPYWREATRAEAQLLLGDAPSAQESLTAGITRLPRAWEDHARTIEQFSAIIAAQGGDPAWLDQHRPPCSLHFSGLIGLDPEAPGLIEEIGKVISSINPGFAFGALAAGADILIAEAVSHAGAQLHITLPDTVETFREKSVEPFGSEWASRYDALIEKAARIDCLPFDLEQQLPFAQCIEAASLVSMGQAVRNAEVLSSQAHALTIAATGETDRSPIAHWRVSGRDMHRIETPRVAEGPRGQSNIVGQAEDPSCRGMIALSGLIAGACKSLAERTGLELGEDGSTRTFTGSPASCLAALEQVKRSEEVAGMALMVGYFDADRRDRPTIDRLVHLCDAAEPGQVFTDYQSAMIAQVLFPGIRTEEMGELASLSGPVRLWSLIP